MKWNAPNAQSSDCNEQHGITFLYSLLVPTVGLSPWFESLLVHNIIYNILTNWKIKVKQSNMTEFADNQLLSLGQRQASGSLSMIATPGRKQDVFIINWLFLLMFHIVLLLLKWTKVIFCPLKKEEKNDHQK